MVNLSGRIKFMSNPRKPVNQTVSAVSGQKDKTGFSSYCSITVGVVSPSVFSRGEVLASCNFAYVTSSHLEKVRREARGSRGVIPPVQKISLI